MQGEKVTLKTIADDVGVSISVVSRVLNNRKKKVPITQATKRRILESAIKHNLRTNSNIGIFIPDRLMDYDLVHYPFVAGLFSQAHEYNYGIFCTAFSNNITTDDIPAFLENRQVSGVIFLEHTSAVIIDFLDDNLIPYVLADISGKPKSSNCISIDYYGTTLALLNLLKERGYQEYIFVNDTEDDIAAFKQIEFNCFKQFIAENFFKGEITGYHGDRDDYLKMISSKVKTSTRETVFISETRLFTVEILKLFAVHNKTIPADGGLVGNNLLSEYTVPKLISVKYDFNKIGEQSITMMHGIMTNKHRPVKKIMMAGKILSP
jgi:DNA-binding LacI/PurR family transcriptional regulator